ncbi:DUF1028 domain-containing protein [Methylobacterium mesophilicum]|uniref:DUF1028 domain-containing protein n=1 Tax=Methylobacterium mesophilicum TaxID=39956 RepID=UPI002F35FD84
MPVPQGRDRGRHHPVLGEPLPRRPHPRRAGRWAGSRRRAGGGARHRRPAGPAPARPRRRAGAGRRQGRAAAWTGAGCTAEGGHRTGAGFAVQGNMLAGPGVIDAMAEAFAGSAARDLDERLMRALEAGDAAGGDRRGKQSAALTIVAGEDYPLLDLRVDEHAEPVAELRRVLAVARRQLVPFVAGMPRKDGPAGALPDDVVAMLLRPPAERPGAAGAAAPDLLRDVIGLRQDPARVAHLLAQFAPVLAEIARLRDLDLADIHPPVVFDPTLPYRRVPHDDRRD